MAKRRGKTSRATSNRNSRRVLANTSFTNSMDAELELLHRLRSLASQCKDGRDGDKMLRSALRLSLDFFGAEAGALLMRRPGRREVEPLFSLPKHQAWDISLLSEFLRGSDVQVPPHQMFARIRRHGRMWGLLAIQSSGADYPWDARRALSSVGNNATELLERADEARVREVRARIDRKVLEQLRPQDLFYQILHGIRSLTGYDHSAALLICDNRLNSLKVVAEQIAWCKAKSQKIGLELPLTESLGQSLRAGQCFGFDRCDGDWRSWSGEAPLELADLVDYNLEESLENGGPLESSMLCAPLLTRDGVLGVLKVAAMHPNTFGQHEAQLVSGFLLQAAVALQNLQRTSSLEQQVITAERKHAMADLARGVSHDINNALGSVLPLVQQLRADLDEGPMDPRLLSEDLRQIENSLQVCRRIFGGMLSFARGAAHRKGDVYLHQEVECTLAILQEGLARKNIQLEVDVPSHLPPICGVRADIEQLLLNLFSNARDAMQAGGAITASAWQQADGLELTIRDTGCGIAASDLAKVQEPFFTTKQSGNGLGLAICRSILSELGGSLKIESQRNHGTCVRVQFPVGPREILS